MIFQKIITWDFSLPQNLTKINIFGAHGENKKPSKEKAKKDFSKTQKIPEL